MRFQGGIPSRYLGHYVLTAVYIINRLPSVVLRGKSPYEIFHKHKANLYHLRTFECLCYAKKLNSHDKFDTKAIAVVLMGCSEVIKGYVLLDLNNQKFFVNRDVIFRETVFPFKNRRQSQYHLFLEPDDSYNDAFPGVETPSITEPDDASSPLEDVKVIDQPSTPYVQDIDIGHEDHLN